MIGLHFQIHAENTESFLNGKQLLDTAVVQQALNILSSELKPDYIPPDASAQYKKGLAISLLYKVSSQIVFIAQFELHAFIYLGYILFDL